MTRRRLHPDEIELWRKVTEKAERLNTDRAMKSVLHVDPAKPSARRSKVDISAPLRMPVKPATSLTSADILPDVSTRMAGAPVQMDQKTFGQLKRGKMRPEGRLDLHGMTLDRAHPALTRFILSSHASGKRLVLVITGKGKSRDEGGPIPVRHGVLRHQVPHWLGSPPLVSAVLQVSPAHVRHGGHGAYYVYLRKQR